MLRANGQTYATKDEAGSYQISGNNLIVFRERGTFSTPTRDRALEPETRQYLFRIGNTELGAALQLISPNGESEILYKR